MDDIATGVAEEVIGDVAGGVTESVGEAAGGAVGSVASSLPDVVIIPDSPAELCPELGPVDLDRPVSAAVTAPERPAEPSAPVAAPGPTTAPLGPVEPPPDVYPEPAPTRSAPSAPATPAEPQIEPVAEPETPTPATGTFAPYTPETGQWSAPDPVMPLSAPAGVPVPAPAPSMPAPAQWAPAEPMTPAAAPQPQFAPLEQAERRSWMVALNDWIARTAASRAERREARAQADTREMTGAARAATWLFGAPDPSWGGRSRGVLSAPTYGGGGWAPAGAPAHPEEGALEFEAHPGVDASFASWLFDPGQSWSQGPDTKALDVPIDWLTDGLTERWVHRMRTADESEQVHGSWAAAHRLSPMNRPSRFCAVGFLFDEWDPDGWENYGTYGAPMFRHRDHEKMLARYGRDFLMSVSDAFESGATLDWCANYVQSAIPPSLGTKAI